MSKEIQQPEAFDMEGAVMKIRTMCTLVDRMVDRLLLPSNGVEEGGQFTFRLDEEDMDALCYLSIQARVASRELSEGHYQELERNAKRSAA